MNLQYLITRAIVSLPESVLLRLAGEPPLVVDGQRFDAQAHLLRNVRRKQVPYRLLEPDVAAGRQRYRAETRIFRGPVTKVGSVRELQIDGAAGPMRARHYAPIDTASRDLLVYLHGGGFVTGDLDTHDEPCRQLCRHARTHVLSVDYRLAPEHPCPAALDDTLAALAWAQENFPLHISIGGDSAGANLATVAARLAAKKPFAQLLIYPTTDHAGAYRSKELFGEGHILTNVDVDAFRDCYLGATTIANEDTRVAPLRAADLAEMPPALLITAGFDLLRDEGEAYARKLAAAGVTVRSWCASSLPHGFTHMTGVCAAARDAALTIARDWRSLLDEQS
jgi:acetyl esterase